MKAWIIGIGAFGMSSATVVAVNPGGVVTNAVNVVQHQVQSVTGTGGSGGAVGGGTTVSAPSITSGCHSH
ncbi:MAG TPA: hypothetical protein VI319_12360 [Burkholderiales bacterium]